MKSPTIPEFLLATLEKIILDLALIYGEQAEAKYCPQFDSVDSGFINKRSKLVPKLPECLNETEF